MRRSTLVPLGNVLGRIQVPGAAHNLTLVWLQRASGSMVTVSPRGRTLETRISAPWTGGLPLPLERDAL